MMIGGTGSGVGKSRLVAGLCRVLVSEGVDVAPFKAQNMALNSFVTKGGAEIGRAQAYQAFAARLEPEVRMNPILLKPTGERSSQVIVMGAPLAELDALAYRARSPELFDLVQQALAELRAAHSVVIAEGAGGVAEINLLQSDIVNLRLAHAAGMKAVVVGDIERGGVFASLYGSAVLLPDELRAVLGGFVINKFRGEPALLSSGISEIEGRLGLRCFGVLPYLDGLSLDAEDSLDPLPSRRGLAPDDLGADLLDVAVIALPHLANVTDFDALALESGLRLRFVEHASLLGVPDLIVLPGSKCTVEDLAWLRASALVRAIERARGEGSALFGICAGYQMIGRSIIDEVESKAGVVAGLGYLDGETVFSPRKWTAQRAGQTEAGLVVNGYEIRHGSVTLASESEPLILATDDRCEDPAEGVADPNRRIWASSWHGLFDNDGFRRSFLAEVAQLREKCFVARAFDFADARELEIERVAELCRAHLDLEALFALCRVQEIRATK